MGKNTSWVGSGIEMGVSMFLVPVSEKEDEKMRCDSEILTSCGCESFWFAQAPYLFVVSGIQVQMGREAGQ